MIGKRRSRYATVDLKKIEERNPELNKMLEKEREHWEHESFVLMPEHDKAARMALNAYANSTKNAALAVKLRRWLDCISRRHGDLPEMRSRGSLNSSDDTFGNR